MRLFAILGFEKPEPRAIPTFIREIQDIRGVRVVRLQGSVGKEIGAQVTAADEDASKAADAFTRPLLFDFKDTSGWDFSTVSYMVLMLRRRMATQAQVGVINAPQQLIAELEVARVEGLIRIFGSEEQALAELSGPSPGR